MALGDVFWDLPSALYYEPGAEIGATVYVANPTEEPHEYSLRTKLIRDTTVLSEEPVTVHGYAWFPVDAGDFIGMFGAFSFDETDCLVSLELVERETEEVVDTAETYLMPLPRAPAWPLPGMPGVTVIDMSNWLMVFLMLALLGVTVVGLLKPKEKKELKAG